MSMRPHDGPGLHRAFLYFSYVTQTTMGYGDITPVTPLARSLATVQAIAGQLYLAVLVARLVALQIVDQERA
jgi:Ion channel